MAGTWRDDFEDNDLKGWKQLVQGGSIKVEDGHAVIIDFGFSRTTGVIFNDGQRIGDFTLTVDARMARRIDNQRDYICVWARDVLGQDPIRGFIWGSFHAMGEVKLALYNANLNEVDSVVFPTPFEVDRWYQIKVKVKGGRMSFSIDGKLIGEKNWTGWAQLAAEGEVGIGVGGAEVHFDNFVITGDEISDGYQPVKSKGKLPITWARLKTEGR